MNKNAIKKYAVTARRKLIEAVSQKMRYYGCDKANILADSETVQKLADSGVYLDENQKRARAALASRVRECGFQIIAEEVAYTWFNRLAALRFMEVKGYLPSGIRMLSSGDENRLEPECVREWERLDFLEKAEAAKAKAQGDEILYRYILVKQCNELGKLIPGMFSKISDYAELLLPDRLYTIDGIVYDLTHSEVEEADFGEQVEIIGWLYQYYISEKKDEVFAALKKNVKITKENVPAATQLFTPDWIVRYMVENSLGRLWLEGHPENALVKNWKYYLAEAEQTPAVEAELEKIRQDARNMKPEEIKLIDPCMGSGHILVYAFDVLYQIYFSQGYAERDIPDLILKNNLFGLDIDERACQLTHFALMMKARSYNRRFFRRDPADIPQPQVYATVGDEELEEYGSLLKVTDAGEKPVLPSGQLTLGDTADYGQRVNAWHCRELLARKYDVVVTNPPYMGSGGMSNKLAEYVKTNFSDSKSDLFAVFMEACGLILKKSAYQAMITQHAWMFQPSFSKLREKMRVNTLVNMSHLGPRAFDEIGGEVVQTTSFVYRKADIEGFVSSFVRLVEQNSESSKEEAFLEKTNIYLRSVSLFDGIPAKPLAYWIGNKVAQIFDGESISKYSISDGQTKTSDNDRFLRKLWEVSSDKIGTTEKWALIAKGGSFRRWAGNLDTVIDWSLTARTYYRQNRVARISPEYIWFRKGVCWNHIGGSRFAARFLPETALFETAAPSIFFNDESMLYYVIGYLNSTVSDTLLKFINPTLSTNVGDITVQPLIKSEAFEKKAIDLVTQNISLSRADWDAFETSWDFKRHPLINGSSISAAFDAWRRECEDRFQTLKRNEEELNRIFIDIYGLQDELTAEVNDKDVTVRKADQSRDIRSFISYAVGCMFGRYSLDAPGLAYAGGTWDATKYTSYIPEDDNILPINDADYFNDDIVVRFVDFVRAVYGEHTLEDNLHFIAETLYPNANGTARDKIRRYFLGDFYKDHLKTYQKKPIYWQFDSGKQGGFKALIYLHRYDKHTIGRVRTEYLHPLQRKYEAEIERLTAIANMPETSARDKADSLKRVEVLRKKIAESRDYDQVIAHIAVQSIDLDLDDGVTANYAKFQGVEIAQGDGRPPVKMDLLAKI